MFTTKILKRNTRRRFAFSRIYHGDSGRFHASSSHRLFSFEANVPSLSSNVRYIDHRQLSEYSSCATSVKQSRSFLGRKDKEWKQQPEGSEPEFPKIVSTNDYQKSSCTVLMMMDNRESSDVNTGHINNINPVKSKSKIWPRHQEVDEKDLLTFSQPDVTHNLFLDPSVQHKDRPTSIWMNSSIYGNKMSIDGILKNRAQAVGLDVRRISSRRSMRTNLNFFQVDSRVYLSTSSSNDETTASNNSKKKTGPSGASSSPPSSSAYSTHAKIPTPKSSPHQSPSLQHTLSSIDLRAMVENTLNILWSATKIVIKFLFKLPGNIIFYSTHPKERKEKIAEIKEAAKKEFDHYWMGTKLLMADIRTARNLVGKTLRGSTLTRRERKQLLRTVSDLFRLVPFSMFLLIPFMEFALPFALRIFPNMLPSTFQDSLKNEENMKRELQSRIAMAQFFQETMEDLAKEQKRIAANRKQGQDEPADSIASKQEACAADMLEFLDRARKGEMLPADIIIQYANYFQDDLTLDNMPRMQLINMCKYMSIAPYGSDSFLRFQLRHRIRMLKEDDQRILWEGIDSLTKMELREACQERGMRSTGLSKEAYKRSLQQWLDLSVNKNVPISLLIMSRTFFLQDEIASPTTAAATDDEAHSVTGLADAISGMDKEVLNEVILQVATSEEKKSDPDVRKIQLEVLAQQNEKIKEEQEERDYAKKKKESSEKGESRTVASDQEDKESVKVSTVVGPVDVGTMSKEEILDAFDDKVAELKEELVMKAAEVETGERELSPEEMEAISQLLSADPVFKEREDLARIKEAMQEEINKAEAKKRLEGKRKETQTDVPVEADSDENKASSIIDSMNKLAAEEATDSTTFSFEEKGTKSEEKKDQASTLTSKDKNVNEEEENEEIQEDPVVAKLKKRIESMVDKIELQLSDAHVKIGEKLHYLDKDMDGILSREEMAEVLSQVLKNISFDEALEIADGIDENKDGVFTVQELIQWIETNKLVKYESEGRDAEMDKIMESHAMEKDEENMEEQSSTKREHSREKQSS